MFCCLLLKQDIYAVTPAFVGDLLPLGVLSIALVRSPKPIEERAATSELCDSMAGVHDAANPWSRRHSDDDDDDEVVLQKKIIMCMANIILMPYFIVMVRVTLTATMTQPPSPK